jgi:hypothetical protein
VPIDISEPTSKNVASQLWGIVGEVASLRAIERHVCLLRKSSDIQVAFGVDRSVLLVLETHAPGRWTYWDNDALADISVCHSSVIDQNGTRGTVIVVTVDFRRAFFRYDVEGPLSDSSQQQQ